MKLRQSLRHDAGVPGHPFQPACLTPAASRITIRSLVAVAWLRPYWH